MAGQLEFKLQTAPRRVALSVTQLVRAVRETLETELDECWVVGEVSNSRIAPSNHLYFTLKDARSSIGVVMFNSALRRLRFRVSDGMQVVVRGRVSLYEARGAVQFYAEEMEPRGLGALQLAYDQLKQRLDQEGLFDNARKRALPILPRTIGIVTALGGAALRDMLRVLFDRYPNMRVIIRPSLVQGAGAAGEIAAAIDDLNSDGRAEVIIAGRGGGSLEDLWAFNEESVARAIYRSAIPLVSAVGHEIDYTIADFVADVRAPTPTGASQLVCPSGEELSRHVELARGRLRREMRRGIENRMQHSDMLGCRLIHPGKRIDDQLARLQRLRERINRFWLRSLESGHWRLRELNQRLNTARPKIDRLVERQRDFRLRLQRATDARLEALAMNLEREQANLAHLNPESVLQRGYSIAYAADGTVLRIEPVDQ